MLENIGMIIKNYFHYYRGKFSCVLEKDHQSCVDFFKHIFHDELRRPDELEQPPIPDQYIIDFTCRDEETHKTIGCCEAVCAKHVKDIPIYADFYQLQTLPEQLLDKIIIVDLLAIHPDYRKSIASFVIFEYVYQYCLKNDYEILIIICEAGLLNLYRHLGLKPYGRMRLMRYGYVIPLYGPIRNYDYVKKHNRHLFAIAKSLNFPSSTLTKTTWKSLDKHFKFKKNKNGYKQADKHFIDTFYSPIIRNMSAMSKFKLLKNALVLYPKKGDIVITKDDGNKYMGIVHHGSFAVKIAGKIVAKLSAGDVFGEISYITHVPRTASVVCDKSGSSIIILSISAIKKIKNSDDLTQFWQNMANILAKKIALTNKKIF